MKTLITQNNRLEMNPEAFRIAGHQLVNRLAGFLEMLSGEEIPVGFYSSVMGGEDAPTRRDWQTIKWLTELIDDHTRDGKLPSGGTDTAGTLSSLRSTEQSPVRPWGYNPMLPFPAASMK